MVCLRLIACLMYGRSGKHTWKIKIFKRNSEIAKDSRNSKGEQDSVHTGRSINFSETWDRVKKKHGDKAAPAAVFMATHTTKGPDSSIKWINPYYQGLFSMRSVLVRRQLKKEVSDLRAPSGLSLGKSLEDHFP